MSKATTHHSTARKNANALRAIDIVKSSREKDLQGSAFLDPEVIEGYDKPIQRPTFHGKLKIK